MREYRSPNTSQPRIALLGREPFTTIVTNAGGGQTRFGPIVVNRWRSDPTLDDFGQFIYIRDLSADRVWSAAHQPVCASADSYCVRLDGESAYFERSDGDIETVMEIAVASDEAAEIRRVRFRNRGPAAHELEVTSYMEVAIATPSADRGHPVFSNLFVQTEWLERAKTILAMRRPRSAATKPIWCGHSVASDDAVSVTCETDRARFIGRGRSVRNPVAMDDPGELSGTTGAVLDPVFAIRLRVSVPPGESREVLFSTFMAEDRRAAVELAKRYSVVADAERSFAHACEEARLLRSELKLEIETQDLFETLAGHLVFPPQLNAASEFGSRFRHFEKGSAKTARASADVPIVLAKLGSERGLESARRLVSAHRYWEARGLESDLMILASESALLSSFDAGGGIYLLDAAGLSSEEKNALAADARMTIDCDDFDLRRYADVDQPMPGTVSTTPVRRESVASSNGEGLEFFNGFGGFNRHNEYEIRLTGEALPPAPWINVIANEDGGFIVSESGAGPTWATNSSQFRLTPWQNDPVSDRIGECIYIRDEETGEIWSPTPAPIRDSGRYVIRHGAGYSIFEHEHDGLATSLRVGVPVEDAVKLQVLTITNNSARTRQIGLTSYVEWVLGGTRELTRHSVRTAYDEACEAILARNPLDPEFADMVAFAVTSADVHSHTRSRDEFIGRNGSYSSPAWLMSDVTGPGGNEQTDPCAVLASVIDLEPGDTRQVAFLVGAANGPNAAKEMIARYRDPEKANAAIDRAAAEWRSRLEAISVKTPEPSFDLMLNQWALYQSLAGRIWGRIALYQSSGAYGFRDQLQDVTALVYAAPDIAREQIIRAASRQFEEGDVQHWWHPHSGRGIRTRFADDLVWLPFVLDHYLRVTHDFSLLDVETPYLRMRELEADEEEIYAVPDISETKRSIFYHCVHALNRATTAGVHGLPLIRSGDWNDGMNRVGVDEKGESVWLGWFFIDTLRRFAVYADARGEAETAKSFRQKASDYKRAIEESAWDGEWYRRAYYDDGAPLGSHVNTECQIDSIAQSWSVISGAGDSERAMIAMESLNSRLVREDARLIMLLTPPFDRGTHDPGYIQGYLPGVRENGAQYTHAALWAVLATALQGNGDRAFELYQMINPVTHASSPEDAAVYKVEPYVVAADVYTAEGHLGRGGWTWYTGSASWLYRVGLEGILGLSKRGETLEINPCIPSSWKEFSIAYRCGESQYFIHVRNPSGVERGVVSIVVDGTLVEGVIHLFNDGQRHDVTVTMGTV